MNTRRAIESLPASDTTRANHLKTLDRLDEAIRSYPEQALRLERAFEKLQANPAGQSERQRETALALVAPLRETFQIGASLPGDPEQLSLRDSKTRARLHLHVLEETLVDVTFPAN